MTGRIILALMVVVTAAGCSRVTESRLNPFNWFGRSQSSESVTNAPNPNDSRPLISQIVSLRVEQVPGGAIVHATGLPARQGFFDGVLVPVGLVQGQAGILNFEFRVSPPLSQTRVSTQQSREVIVGRFVSEQMLVGVSQIRVSGSGNALMVRR